MREVLCLLCGAKMTCIDYSRYEMLCECTQCHDTEYVPFEREEEYFEEKP